MVRRNLSPFALAGLLFTVSGCASRQKVASHAAPHAPRSIESEEEYGAARADFDALALDAPERAAHRAVLESFLVHRLSQTLDRGHLDDAYDLFRQALTLYEPSELGKSISDQALLQASEAFEREARHRGAHEETVVALVVEQALSSTNGARERYQRIVEWLQASGAIGGELGESTPPISGSDRLINDLEAAARVWPSPWVVEQLTALYTEQENESPSGQNRTRTEGLRLVRRSAAYPLARLYLRTSQLDRAIEQLKRLAAHSSENLKLSALLEQLASPSAKPADAIKVAALFMQSGRDDRDVAERVCNDAARRFRNAAEPRLCAGELAASRDRLVVALHNFEEAVRLEPTRREAWEALAKLYQLRLMQVVSDENLDLAQLEEQLRRTEHFHVQARERFADKPIRPSMAGALYEVGRGYFNVGRLDQAAHYLELSAGQEQSPSVLELLGQIAAKQGHPTDAVHLFERAVALPKGERAEQIYWRAKLRRELADALELTGSASDAATTRRAGVEDWEMLASLGVVPEIGMELLLEKGKLLYQLGDREGALAAFARAIDTAPERGSIYADVIAFLIPRGELDEALDAYHRALGRAEVTDYLKVYCSLWIIDLCHRAGQPEDPLATAFLRSTDGSKWYDDLARWATGRESDATLAERADTPARRAEAAFYRAMRALGEGKGDEAKRLWKQVLSTDMMAFFEYDMAAYYLKRGDAPRLPVLTPRSTNPERPAQRRIPDGAI